MLRYFKSTQKNEEKENVMLRKSVIVIGATGGIGEAVVEKFASEGYNVIATFNQAKTQSLIEIGKRFGVKLDTMKVDVTNSNDITALFNKAFKENEYVDALICCSGVSIGEKMLCDCEEEEIDRMLDINLRGTIFCNKEAVKHFISQKHGSIVNISSIYGIYGGSCEVAYSASKAGVIGLTKALSQEVGNAGVRVNAIAPGFIETNMTSGFNNEERSAIIQSTPLKRLGKSQDVANVAYFLASEESSFITGQTIEVSGGATIF